MNMERKKPAAQTIARILELIGYILLTIHFVMAIFLLGNISLQDPIAFIAQLLILIFFACGGFLLLCYIIYSRGLNLWFSPNVMWALTILYHVLYIGLAFYIFALDMRGGFSFLLFSALPVCSIILSGIALFQGDKPDIDAEHV